MLEFFRRYQKFFFIIVTCVIVISFTFFGTYDAFVGSAKENDTVAFTAVDGCKISGREFSDLVNFLSVDHPFSDDVIENNFLLSGIAEVIAEPFLAKFQSELQSRHEKEKRFVPYANAQAPFVGVEAIWSYFAPDIKTYFEALKSMPDAATKDAFSCRVKLYLAERRFPAGYQKRILKYQEKQHSWLAPDEGLAHRDLSLFGYHNLQDWFGKNFLELVGEYIINCAKIAESKGYSVSKAEAMQSLMANLNASFKEASANPYNAISNVSDYYLDALRRLNMDEARLVQAAKKVLLFRNYFNANKDAILVSTLPYRDFLEHQNEFVEAKVYKLPSELTFQKMADLEKFEIYVNAVRDPKEPKAKLPMPPQKYLSLQEIKKSFPELVQKRYRLRYATCNKEALEAKIGLRGTWQWQKEDAGFKMLQDKFPEIAGKFADNRVKTKEERQVLLDALDSKTRSRIDDFSREQIVNLHPEWVEETLASMPMKEEVVDIREQGGQLPFSFVNDRAALMALLDKASPNVASSELSCYTQDKVHYYRIVLLDSPEKEQLLTFKEAKQDGTLDQIYNTMLEATYTKVRSKFTRENGEYKPFAEVKDQIGDIHFEELIETLDEECQKEQKEAPQFCNWKDKDEARLAVRLLPYMRSVLKKIKADPKVVAKAVVDQKAKGSNPLQEQWKLVEANEKVSRGQDEKVIAIEEAFLLQPDLFSTLSYTENAGITFFKVYGKGTLPFEEDLRAKVMEARALLAGGLELELAKSLLTEMQQKNAIAAAQDGTKNR